MPRSLLSLWRPLTLNCHRERQNAFPSRFHSSKDKKCLVDRTKFGFHFHWNNLINKSARLIQFFFYDRNFTFFLRLLFRNFLQKIWEESFGNLTTVRLIKRVFLKRYPHYTGLTVSGKDDELNKKDYIV